MVLTAEPTDGPAASGRQLALVLGGGGARGLAHIGVLEVLEREGIRPACIIGSSMGGLVGALSAAGLGARDIIQAARDFSFPWWFIVGRVVEWEAIFPSADRLLAGLTFEQLRTPLAISAVDFERGEQVVLNSGPLVPAVRATCAIPGVLPAVRLGGRWLVDGSLVNVLPVDVAWMQEPEVVVAVNVGGLKARPMPELGWRATSFLSRLGGIIPNPATAKVAFEVLLRATEILLAHQTALASAMASPEVLIEPRLRDIGLRDFDRLDEAVGAGRRAAEEALPALYAALQAPRLAAQRSNPVVTLRFDPVCGMVISPTRARASAIVGGEAYYFCSTNCRDCFEREPNRYVTSSAKVPPLT